MSNLRIAAAWCAMALWHKMRDQAEAQHIQEDDTREFVKLVLAEMVGSWVRTSESELGALPVASRQAFSEVVDDILSRDN